jgi:hypothetical protein
VTCALNLWGATRLTEIPWRICGENLLGLKPPSQPGNPWNGIVPVTPIMDTQLDELVIRCQLNPHKERFLQEFEELIMQNKRENWLEIYLGMFVVLCNVEWILKDVMDYTSRHSIKVCTSPYLILHLLFIFAFYSLNWKSSILLEEVHHLVKGTSTPAKQCSLIFILVAMVPCHFSFAGHSWEILMQ